MKAAYIFNFAKFIDWPPQAFDDPTSPVVVGVLGNDPFGSFLDKTLEGESVGGRPFVIKRLKGKTCQDCHFLFVSGSEAGHIKEILDANQRKNIVTISDIPQFNAKGGVIHLFTDKNKVRFTINTQAAESAGVKISSQLLKLSQAAGGS